MKLNSLSRSAVKRAATDFVAGSSNDRTAILTFFESLDTPKSLAAALLFKYEEHIQLLDLDVNPNDYESTNGDLFHRDYLAVSFLSKYDSLKTGYDTKERGFAKFLQFEALCKETNIRFSSDSDLEKSEFALLLFVMRRKIDLILGEFDIEEFFENSAWGPGVSTQIKGSDTSATRKFQQEAGITRDAYTLMSSSLRAAYPLWFEDALDLSSFLHIEVGNTVTNVPKNSKIDRIIAVEPGLNLYFQKGVGQMIKRRLRARGVDLRNQKTNQEAALLGSLNGETATVDFSSASDSIARNVVRNLFPVRWYLIMDSLRSKVGSLEGKSFTWEKFSSMGNGFTFELESLIFYAAALASCEAVGVDSKTVSVYGDDVIIPVGAFDMYERFCRFLGFTVNKTKSFASGAFRESCGSHYFSGLDVKPIFHKKVLTDALSIYKLANSVRRLAHRRCFNNGCDRRLLPIWRNLVSGLPHALRSVKIPDGFGDGGLVVNFDEACPPRALHGHEGYDVIMLSERGVKQPQSEKGLLLERLTQIEGAASLYLGRGWTEGREFNLSSHERYALGSDGLSSLGYGNDTTLRGRSLLALSGVRVHQWYNLGGWV